MDCFVEKELTGWPHPGSCGQWLSVQEICDELRASGDTAVRAGPKEGHRNEKRAGAFRFQISFN